MALINTLLEFNKYVTVSSDFDEAKFLKYTQKAEQNIIRLIGFHEYDKIVKKSKRSRTRKLLCEYSANMGLSYALPSFVLNITTAGVFTNATTDSQRAEWWQMKDLNRSLLKFAFSSLDDALHKIGIDKVTQLSGLLISSLEEFELAYSISGSSQTFISLIPFIREVQDQYINNTLGNCYNYNFSDEQNRIIRAAIVNLALSKAATSGSFSVEANAIILRVEIMPWEKVEKIEQIALEKFREDRYNVGMGYLNSVLKFIKELPCYVESENQNKIEKYNSGLYL